VVAGLSALPFAAGLLLPGVVILAVGIAIAAASLRRYRRK
jgi:hypothetical protein